MANNVTSDPPFSNASGASRPHDRGAARREAFLQAARDVFLEQGYEAASVNDVVRRAGGSLATLYAQFGNKEGLFQAVMLDQHRRFANSLSMDCVNHLPLEEGLQAIGEHYLKLLLTRETIAYFRVVMSEARKLPPPLQQTLSTSGSQVQEVVTDFLRRHITEPLPDMAASRLLDMWRSQHHFRALADENYTFTETDITRHVAGAVQVFLHGITARA